MKAFAINCTLKPSPAQSNTDSLLEIVLGGLQKRGVEVDAVRAVDHDIKPGVESDMGDGDGPRAKPRPFARGSSPPRSS